MRAMRIEHHPENAMPISHLRAIFSKPFQSQRDYVLQPRVASLRATLGSTSSVKFNLEGVVAFLASAVMAVHVRVDRFKSRNPFRVDTHSPTSPRVARLAAPKRSEGGSSQP